jgi:hypothetical protein
MAKSQYVPSGSPNKDHYKTEKPKNPERHQKYNLVKQLRKHHPTLKIVVDAAGPMDIAVNRADVGKAKRKDTNQCAIAVAAMRTEEPDAVVASRSRLYIIKNNIAYRYIMPVTAIRELTSFDRGASFSPGVYHMCPPTHTSSLGADRVNHKTHSRGNGGTVKRKTVIDNIRASIWES